MTNDDAPDPRIAEQLRRFADTALVGFEPERTAAEAMRSPSRSALRSVMTTLAAAGVVGVAVGLAVLGGKLVFNGTATDPSRGPAFASPSLPSVLASPRSEATPLPSAESQALDPPPPSGAPPGGMTRSEAIDAARRAAPHAAAYPEVIRADAGPFETQGVDWLDYAERPADTRWVWVVILCDGCGPTSGDGTVVVLDYLDGRVYSVMNFIG